MDAGDILEKKAKLFREKRKQYGKTDDVFAEVMAAMFPSGLFLETKQDWHRYGLFHMIVHKTVRLGNKLLSDELAMDNVADIQVYAAMLEEIIKDEDS